MGEVVNGPGATTQAPEETRASRGPAVNAVQLLGRLAADPDLRYRPDGKPVAEMRIATNERPEADPVMAILTLDHIRGPWLRTLDTLTGEDEPDALPGKRLA